MTSTQISLLCPVCSSCVFAGPLDVKLFGIDDLRDAVKGAVAHFVVRHVHDLAEIATREEISSNDSAQQLKIFTQLQALYTSRN